MTSLRQQFLIALFVWLWLSSSFFGTRRTTTTFVGMMVMVDAAHAARTRIVSSSSSHGSHHYDRSITTFNDEGRLLQVEYGMEATVRPGSTAVVVALQVGEILEQIMMMNIHHPSKDYKDEDTTTSSSGSSSSSSSSTPGEKAIQDVTILNNSERDTIYLVTRHASSSSSSSSSSFSHPKVYRIDDHIFLTATGLVGDTQFMVEQLRNYCQAFKHQYYGEAPTVRDVATMAATWHHTVTRREGARPLATTCLLVGIDDSPTRSDGSNKRCSSSSIFRTGPGGSVEEYRYCAIGPGQDSILKTMSGTIQKLFSQNNNHSHHKPTIPQQSSVVESLLRGTLQAMDIPKNEVVDVWRIRRRPRATTATTDGLHQNSQTKNENNVVATCFQGVTVATLKQITDAA